MKLHTSHLVVISIMTLISSLTIHPDEYKAASLVSFEDAVSIEAEAVKSYANKKTDQYSDAWKTMDVPIGNTGFKSQESYKVFKNPSTLQYQLQHSGKTWTDGDGFRRYGDEGHYMVAVGSYYASTCGTLLRVTLDSGRVITAIVGDQKSDMHTDAKHQKAMDGSVLEFIVDLQNISDSCRLHGDMSHAPSTNMHGNIVKIERYMD